MIVYCTTSNKYLHLLKPYSYLFNEFWSQKQEVIVVGYDKPNFELPDNFKFHSLGKQTGGPKMWATDLRKFFESIDDEFFVWSMEDTFFKDYVDIETFNYIKDNLLNGSVGKVGLTDDISNRKHQKLSEVQIGNKNVSIIESDGNTQYRLSCQISIWNRKFLLKYLRDGLDPWQFETQHPSKSNDNMKILSTLPPNDVMKINEGVRKWDVYKLNLDDIPQEIINDMKEKKLI